MNPSKSTKPIDVSWPDIIEIATDLREAKTLVTEPEATVAYGVKIEDQELIWLLEADDE